MSNIVKNTDMASVIELGSSDEEPEPPAKKAKQPKPNAMVCIPNSTLKKIAPNDLHRRKIIISSNLQNLIRNPFANTNSQVFKNTTNGTLKNAFVLNSDPLLVPRIISKPQRAVIPGAPVQNIVRQSHKAVVQKKNVNKTVTSKDMATAKKILLNMQKSVPIKKIVPSCTLSKNQGIKIISPPITSKQGAACATTTIKKQITHLPPEITIKRVAQRQNRQLVVSSTERKKNENKPSVFPKVSTVELDDEDESTSFLSNNPHWYILPENKDENEEKSKMQEKKITKMIEITIDGSQAKPCVFPNIAASSNPSVIIEDSPQKTMEGIQSCNSKHKTPQKFSKDININRKSPNREEKRKFCKHSEERTIKSADKVTEMIEITIDDSPVKPPALPTIATSSDLSIIIEDSPQKTIEDIRNCSIKHVTPQKMSKDENIIRKSPKSKKKLNYISHTTSLIEVQVDFPKTSNPVEIFKCPANGETVPVEFEVPIIPAENIKVNDNRNTPIKICGEVERSIYDEMPNHNTDYGTIHTSADNDQLKQNNELKDSNVLELHKKKVNDDVEIDLNASKCKSFPPKNISESPSVSEFSLVKNEEIDVISKNLKSFNEFSEIYCEFINLCFEIENSDDMKKIIEKKVKEYYRQVDKNYTESKSFLQLVSLKIQDIRSCPENLYLYIKDIVDVLKVRRKQKIETNQEAGKIKESGDENEERSKREESQKERHIRILEKTLNKLHRAVRKLEEQEVNLDGEHDSVYILTERYKERLVNVHAKLCQLTGTKMPSEPKLRLAMETAGDAMGDGGVESEAARRLELWVNSRAARGDPAFPDLHDVVQCVRTALHHLQLSWSDTRVLQQARHLFARCGKMLQQRRQRSEWRLAAARLADSSDPADRSAELRTKLEENRKLAVHREAQVINEFVHRQSILTSGVKEMRRNYLEDCERSSEGVVEVVDTECITNSQCLSKQNVDEGEKCESHRNFTNPSLQPNHSLNDTHDVKKKTWKAANFEESLQNHQEDVADTKDYSEGSKQIELESESEQIQLAVSEVDSDSVSDEENSLLEERMETLTSSVEPLDSDSSAYCFYDSQDCAENQDTKLDNECIEDSFHPDAEKIKSGDNNTNENCSRTNENHYLLEIDSNDKNCEKIDHAGFLNDSNSPNVDNRRSVDDKDKQEDCHQLPNEINSTLVESVL